MLAECFRKGVPPFVKWTVSPFLVLVILLLISEDYEHYTSQGFDGFLYRAGILLILISGLLALWGISYVGRIVSAAITSFCVFYVYDEALEYDSSVGLFDFRSDQTLLNSILCFCVFGLPCLYYTIFGRFNLIKEQTDSHSDYHDLENYCELTISSVQVPASQNWDTIEEVIQLASDILTPTHLFMKNCSLEVSEIRERKPWGCYFELHDQKKIVSIYFSVFQSDNDQTPQGLISIDCGSTPFRNFFNLNEVKEEAEFLKKTYPLIKEGIEKNPNLMHLKWMKFVELYDSEEDDSTLALE